MFTVQVPSSYTFQSSNSSSNSSFRRHVPSAELRDGADVRSRGTSFSCWDTTRTQPAGPDMSEPGPGSTQRPGPLALRPSAPRAPGPPRQNPAHRPAPHLADGGSVATLRCVRGGPGVSRSASSTRSTRKPGARRSVNYKRSDFLKRN